MNARGCNSVILKFSCQNLEQLCSSQEEAIFNALGATSEVYCHISKLRAYVAIS